MKKFLSLPNLLISLGVLFLALSFGPLIKDEVWFYFKELKNQKYLLGNQDNKNESVFGKLLSSTTILIKPVNTDFSLVIERIDVNAPVVADVPVSDAEAYKTALKKGIAHAAFSEYPSEGPGIVYLFAHASLNFWDLGKYATVFNLLRKLSFGDSVHVFYKGNDYLYTVVNKEVVPGWNTSMLSRSTLEPLLLLQTCDPPGTTLNRFIVTAKLKEVKQAFR